MEGYCTVAEPAHGEFTEQKSRFLGVVAPAAGEAEALAVLERVRAEHRAAAHNAYAFRLRGADPGNAGTERRSDDGEPRGTAGAPALEVLRKAGLTDVCLVITRYFGGILLGAGGLTRAYSHAAALAVGAARIRRMEPCVRLRVGCGYAMAGRLAALWPAYGVKVEAGDFGAEVGFSLLTRADRLSALLAALTETSAGRATIGPPEELFAELP